MQTQSVPEIEDGPSDLDLVQKCRKGDQRAFEVLVQRYRGKVYSMIYNLINNDADAWDLSQEVFIKAWKALPKFEERASFYTWLYRIAHNVCYDAMRKKRIKGVSEFDDAMHNRVAPGAMTAPNAVLEPDMAMQQGELGVKIRQALEQLSEEHRTAICLKEINGLRYHEIAEVMNCSTGTVMSRLFYARKKLQEILKNEYETIR